MATEITDIVTEEGNLDLMDRTGGRIYLVVADEAGDTIDLSSMDLYLETGTVSIATTVSGSDTYFDVAHADCEAVLTGDFSRFAIIDKNADPDEVIWEGYIFIRTVD